ncbi:MAG: SDR family oxidoreductase [Solirubrobacteraceae bacterium]
MARTALVTGFPGFIGRRLVRALLAEHDDLQVVALVEPRMAAAARELAQDRLEILEGDISERRLGLGGSDWERLTSDVTHVFHLAAIYDLAVPDDVAQRVNVDGTGNVLELCLAAERLERHVYVSTAYVAGRRHGVVYEHELVMGQDFKNHYESTKFQAEVWVRETLDHVPTTILRPAIVVGDSQTGETEKFDGPYYILRTIERMEGFGRAVAQFGASDSPFNVVPVDFVVRAITATAFLPAAEGQTLHLVDPDPLLTSDLVTTLSRAYVGRDPKGRVPPALVEASLRSKRVRQFFGGTPRESVAYLNHSVAFDTRRAVDLLGPLGLAPPRFDEYVDAMVGYFKANAARTG